MTMKSDAEESQEHFEMFTTRDKAIQLFTYLKELSKLRTTHTKDVAKYDEVLWFSDIPKEKGCHCVAWQLWDQRDDEREERVDVWVEVHKPTLRSPPEVPDELEQWIKEDEVSNSTLEEPRLRDIVTIVSDPDSETGEEQAETLSIDDHDDIFEMWMEYTEDKWKPWAEEDRRLQSVQKVYNILYTIYQRSEKLGEQYEVVVGLGFMLWRSPKSGEIRHPLLTLKARVGFDRVRGIMSVAPSLDGPQPGLEIDMLENEDRPSVRDQQAIQDMVDELDGAPWDDAALEAVLKSLANAVSTKSRYDRCITKPPQISEAPQLHFAPSLILRKRSRRTFVDFYSRIVKQLEDGGEVPDGVRDLVEIVEDEQLVDERDPNEHPSHVQISDTELYFPLPANDEQKQIAQRIERGRGILVQGPPGTGKSHAITNLVAHLLAKGRRVLVTSETPRALEVLKDMLPEEIRELCVMWLGSGPQAQTSLEESVHGITQRKVNWDRENAANKIAELERRLDQTRTDQAKVWRDLTACREADTYQHTDVFGEYSGTLEKIAICINNERQRFRWFLDRPESTAGLGVTSDELLELLKVDRQLTDDLEREIRMRHVPENCLISPAEFKELVDSERDILNSHERAERKRGYPGYESLLTLSPNTRARMLDLLRKLIGNMDELAKHVHGWVDRAAREVASGQDRAWRDLLEFTEESLQKLSGRSREASALRVIGLEGHDYSEVTLHARELKAHLESGKGLGFLGLFRAKVVKEAWYLVSTVRVEGELCRSLAALQKLLDWLNYERRLSELAERWKAYTTPPEGNYAARIAAYEDLSKPLRDAVALHGTVQELKGLVSQLADLASPRWHVGHDVEALCDAVKAADLDERLSKAREAFAPLERKITEMVEHNDTHPTTQRILDALHEPDAAAYEQTYDHISQMNNLIRRYELARDVLQRLKTSAPTTAAEYESTYHEDVWDGRFKDFRDAWNWAKTDRWLAEMCSDNHAKQLAETLEHSQTDERRILKELAAKKAWQHCMTALGEHERQALIAWMQAVRKIRGGTGRHAERYREEARQKLAACRGAIPAWVMPLYQVVQTTSPQKGLFDLVIVDEASQSGPEALLLSYIGNQIIVVGDDKQITPLNPGVNRDDVTRLREMHLQRIPHREAFDLEGSLFSQAQLRFSGGVRLREHFRCMPEIIQFSNRLSYTAEPLIPLRQFGADRLKPCRTTHVVEGYRRGRYPNIENEPEARALVNQVVQCLEDPAYEGKSFGIITLLGGAQAPLIANLLMQEVGADEIEKRRLMCGRPYDFQGDERHVIFLSMVDAPQDGHTCRMVRDEETQRRFNVAASRAKDQLWLFHSPTLNDLRTECLRYRLLEHCLNPSVEQTKVGDLDLGELRRLATPEVRGRRSHPEPFDSWFELDVFLRIAERGYRVLPQYEVANRKIDLVVEGLQGKLAVECYGDHWHGPDQFNKDMERQRQLERCQWTFCIVWGSQFYRDPDAALQPLWEELEARNIYPEDKWQEERRRKQEFSHDIAEDYAEDETTPERSRVQENSTARKDRLDQFATDDRHKGKRPPKTIPAGAMRNAIIAALEKCPHNTCTVKSITSRVLKELGIITRGNPRLEFEKRVKRHIGVLSQEGLIEEYKSKNKRLRLLKNAGRNGPSNLFSSNGCSR